MYSGLKLTIQTESLTNGDEEQRFLCQEVLGSNLW